MVKNKYVTANGNELVMSEDEAKAYSAITTLTLRERGVSGTEDAKPSTKTPKVEKVSDLKSTPVEVEKAAE